MVCTLVSSLLQGQGNHIAQTTAEAMLKLGDFLKGLRLILEVSRTWPEDGPVGHMLRTRGAMITAIIKFPTMEIPTMGLPLEETRRFNRMRNGTKVEEQIFRHAIDLLEESIHGTRLLFPWIKKVEPRFLLYLRDGDDIALMIFMQWGVLLDQHYDLWWAKFSGKLLVDDISRTLDAKEEDYAVVTKWCRIQVGLRV